MLADGDFEVTYTCPEKDFASTFELSFGSNKLTWKITKAHNPPLKGMEYDRVERMESYVKDFKPLTVGVIHLDKGKGKLFTFYLIPVPSFIVR